MRRTSSMSVSMVQVMGASSMAERTSVSPTPPCLTKPWITSRKVSMPTTSPCSMSTRECGVGSLVGRGQGDVGGMLTFREVIEGVVKQGGGGGAGGGGGLGNRSGRESGGWGKRG